MRGWDKATFSRKYKLHLGLLVAVHVDAVVFFHAQHKLLNETPGV